MTHINARKHPQVSLEDILSHLLKIKSFNSFDIEFCPINAFKAKKYVKYTSFFKFI